MTESEGVIQYRLDYRPGALPARFDPTALFDWFGRCRIRQLIGQDPQRYAGSAFGNISARADRGFVISGTQTGGKAGLCADDLAWVTRFDSAANCLQATGPARPSSEAMSHGEIYRALPDARAVIHVHAPIIWHAARQLGLPTTDPAAGYGTPAMANEVRRLLIERPAGGILAMGGHEDGIMAYAADMDTAGRLLLDALAAAEAIGVER